MKPDTSEVYRSQELFQRFQKLGTEMARYLPQTLNSQLRSLVNDFRIHRIEWEIHSEHLLRMKSLLEESRNKYRHLYDFAPIGYLSLDENGIISEANLTVAELLLVMKEELIGRSFSDFITPNSRDMAWSHLRQTLKNHTRGSCELELTRGNGDTLYVQLESTALQDVAGDSQRLRTTLTDITQRKRAEEALQLEREKIMRILDSMADAVCIIDEHYTVLYGNPALKMQLGSYNGLKCYGYFHGRQEPCSNCNMKEVLAGNSYRAEWYCSKSEKNYDQIYTRLSTTSEAISCLGILRDVTDQRRLRDNLQFYVTQITKVQEEERKRIAHELHDDTIQALFSLLTDVDDIISGGEKLSSADIRRLEQLKDRIDHIMGAVRCFSHELRPGLLDQFGLIPSLEVLVKETNAKGGLNCKFKVTGRKKRLLPEVELVLFRVSQEALHNVRKHSQASKVLVSLKFEWDSVKLDIIDNGIGFRLPKRIDGFVHNGKLGLVGMSERTRLIGGTFSIESKIGGGTTLTVRVDLD